MCPKKMGAKVLWRCFFFFFFCDKTIGYFFRIIQTTSTFHSNIEQQDDKNRVFNVLQLKGQNILMK